VNVATSHMDILNNAFPLRYYALLVCGPTRGGRHCAITSRLGNGLKHVCRFVQKILVSAPYTSDAGWRSVTVTAGRADALAWRSARRSLLPLSCHTPAFRLFRLFAERRSPSCVGGRCRWHAFLSSATLYERDRGSRYGLPQNNAKRRDNATRT